MNVSFEDKMGEVFPHFQARKHNIYVHLSNVITSYCKVRFYRAPIVDENLNIISRWGLRWWVRVVVNPAFQLFGYDLLASVRADRVAAGILRYFKTHKLKDKALWIRRIDRELDNLNLKTRLKYQQSIERIKEEFKKLFPEPISERPQEPEVSSPDPRVLVWPPYLSDLGIDETLKGKIEGVFAEFIQSQKKEPSLIREKVIDPEKGLKLRFFYENNQLSSVQLLTGKEFTLGVFLCYDLTRGQYFINKKSVSEEERGLLRRLDKRQRGLELVFAIIRTSLDGQPETWEMIERYRAGALPALFNTKPLADPTQQKVLAEDLLSALKFIHTQPKTVNFSNAHGDMLEKEAFLFHGDISSAHILVEKEGERWRAILSKFKATGRFTACLGQEGFRSPNGVKFYTRVKVEKLDQPWVVQFNMEHGQKEDIWAMGLVILSILCGHKGEGLKNMMPKGLEEYGPPDISMMNISPLPCLERCLSRIKEPTATEVDAGVMDLTDGELAQDLEMLHKRYIDFHRKNSSETAKLWDLVKKMLKVDPAERISAGDALILLAK